MARRRYDDDDDYAAPPPPARPGSGIGAGIGLGALAGLVGGEGFLVLSGMEGMKAVNGPGAAFLAAGLCFLIFLLAPVFILLGISGGVMAVRTRSTILGVLIGAAAGPALVFTLWACGAISITVNGQPVKFDMAMALWCSARLWVPGAVGGLFAGLLVPKERPPAPPSDRGKRYDEEEEEDDDRDERPRRRRRDEDDDRGERRRRR